MLWVSLLENCEICRAVLFEQVTGLIAACNVDIPYVHVCASMIVKKHIFCVSDKHNHAIPSPFMRILFTHMSNVVVHIQ